MSTSLDETLRTAVRDLAADAAPAPDLALRALGQGRRLRRRRRVTTAAATVVAVIAVILPFVLLRPRPTPPPATPPPTPTPRSDPNPARPGPISRWCCPATGWSPGDRWPAAPARECCSTAAAVDT
ncbi:hypothetical protein [Micromonospora robiginosa]|uniref:Uncharacterized protein n=1 Tax=Micromonospora robiginosa TaxID=2749844 RepID=A0AAF0P6E0_9ACTN|nr:hypothetical protein [Micromonospora ferruginea]WMF04611.1 hypothetical protein H1D33_30380 [Micromonospora ferruginea]